MNIACRDFHDLGNLNDSEGPIAMPVDTKKYLEYLDKEMTIMGILSAVALVAPAGILNALLGDKSSFKEELWGAGPFFVAGGSIFCVLAGLLFYTQRSLLAWYYGQMGLIESLDESSSIPAELREYMHGADSWRTWIPYTLGFTALVAGFLEYALAALFVLANPYSSLSFASPNKCLFQAAKIFGRIVVPLVAVAFGLLQVFVLTRYSNHDSYWSAFWSDVRHLLGARYPHERVYTRLKPSSNHGVGVFAIRDIPKGTYVFEPDDDTLVSVSINKIDRLGLTPAVRQLYEDFCVKRSTTYECPSTFNKLTPSWYLNTSTNPNVAADLSLKFYATRDIQAGEELTTDYSTYSD